MINTGGWINTSFENQPTGLGIIYCAMVEIISNHSILGLSLLPQLCILLYTLFYKISKSHIFSLALILIYICKICFFFITFHAVGNLLFLFILFLTVSLITSEKKSIEKLYILFILLSLIVLNYISYDYIGLLLFIFISIFIIECLYKLFRSRITNDEYSVKYLINYVYIICIILLAIFNNIFVYREFISFFSNYSNPSEFIQNILKLIGVTSSPSTSTSVTTTFPLSGYLFYIIMIIVIAYYSYIILKNRYNISHLDLALFGVLCGTGIYEVLRTIIDNLDFSLFIIPTLLCIARIIYLHKHDLTPQLCSYLKHLPKVIFVIFFISAITYPPLILEDSVYKELEVNSYMALSDNIYINYGLNHTIYSDMYTSTSLKYYLSMNNYYNIASYYDLIIQDYGENQYNYLLSGIGNMSYEYIIINYNIKSFTKDMTTWERINVAALSYNIDKMQLNCVYSSPISIYYKGF